MTFRKLAFGLAVLVQMSGMALADGDATKGEQVSRKCMACHDFAKATNKTGPHLIGVIGRPVASVEGFKYSEAMTAYAGKVPVWDEAALGIYLENPRAVVVGTRMSFAGLKKVDERTDLIAYLKSIARQVSP